MTSFPPLSQLLVFKATLLTLEILLSGITIVRQMLASHRVDQGSVPGDDVSFVVDEFALV